MGGWRGRGSGLWHFSSCSLFSSFHLPGCSPLAARRVLGPEFCLFFRKTLGILNLTLNTVSFSLNLPEVVQESGEEEPSPCWRMAGQDKNREVCTSDAPRSSVPWEHSVCLSLLGGLGRPSSIPPLPEPACGGGIESLLWVQRWSPSSVWSGGHQGPFVLREPHLPPTTGR